MLHSAAAQFDTIRPRLLEVGAEDREMRTKLRFILPSSFPLKHVFAVMLLSDLSNFHSPGV